MATYELAIVSPIYNAEIILEKLITELKYNLSKLGVSYEIILVDDRSQDNSWDKLVHLSKFHKEVKIVRLSKNFGQHAAIMAGLNYVNSEWVVVMDCDLQDQPKEILKLYYQAKEGYDIVWAKREIRIDSLLKKLASMFFSKIFNYLTDFRLNNSVANFGIYKKEVIIEVIQMNDYIKSFPLFVKWVGFKSIEIPVEHARRVSGHSTYTFGKLFNLALNTIISFSNKPLLIFIKLGFLISILSFLYMIYILFQFLTGEIIVIGYSSIIISICFFSGVIMLSTGILGAYIGKIFDQVKGRKSFIVEKYISNG